MPRLSRREGSRVTKLRELLVHPLLLAGLLGAGPAVATSPPCLAPAAGYITLAHKGYQLHFRPSAAPIPVGSPFSLDIVMCPRDGGTLVQDMGVDAKMPDHGHGMLYRAALVRLDEHRWSARGLLFHMRGSWRLSFTLKSTSDVEVLVHDVTVR